MMRPVVALTIGVFALLLPVVSSSAQTPGSAPAPGAAQSPTPAPAPGTQVPGAATSPGSAPPAPAPAPVALPRPHALHLEPPIYPESVKGPYAEAGVVVVSASVDPEGNVIGARLAVELGLPRLHMLLEASAVESVKHWRFEPTLKDGVAVPVRLQVPVQFAPPPSARMNVKVSSGHTFQLAIPFGGLSLIITTPEGRNLVFGPVRHTDSTTDVKISVFERKVDAVTLIEDVETKLGGGPVPAKTPAISLELVEVLLDAPPPPPAPAPDKPLP